MRRRSALLGAIVAISTSLVACGDGDASGVHAGRSDATGTTEPISDNDPEPTVDPAPTPAPSTATTDTAPAAPSGSSDELFRWEEVERGVDEGSLDVPLDYGDPARGTIELYVVRHRATDPDERIGSLLVNPGGPGYGGSYLAHAAEFVFGGDLVERFDIIGWDPRGTGFSEPAVDCIDHYDPIFSIDSSPDDDAEREAVIAAAEQFAAACEERSAAILPHVGTADSARDIDAIRRALGEDTISYFGFSYGSELGAVWIALFPDTVRAAVLDGAADPTEGYLEQNVAQAAGFEAALTTFLARCSADDDCAFHNGGDAEGAFDALMAEIDARPLPVGDRDRPPVTQGVANTAVATSMYSDDTWPDLEEALAAAQEGDGDLLLALYDSYFGLTDGYGDGDQIEAYFAINCLDDPGSSGPDDLFRHEPEFASAAPRLGRSWMFELTVCSVWPAPPAGEVDVRGAGDGPVVVIGATGDAATPLDSTRAMAEALADGRLVIADADQHTGYGTSRCIGDAVDRYLVDLVAPPHGMECS